MNSSNSVCSFCMSLTAFSSCSFPLCLDPGRQDMNCVGIGKQMQNPFLFEMLIFFSFLQWDLFLFMLHGLVEHDLMRTSEIESCFRSLRELPWPSVSN